MPKRGRKKGKTATRTSKRKRTVSPSGDSAENDESISNVELDENTSDVEEKLEECIDKDSDSDLKESTFVTGNDCSENLQENKNGNIVQSGDSSVVENQVDNNDGQFEDNVSPTDLHDIGEVKNKISVCQSDQEDKDNGSSELPSSDAHLNSESLYEAIPNEFVSASKQHIINDTQSHENTSHLESKNDNLENNVNEGNLPAAKKELIEPIENDFLKSEAIMQNETGLLDTDNVVAVKKEEVKPDEFSSLKSPNIVENVVLPEEHVTSSSDQTESAELNAEDLMEIKRKTEELAAQHELELRVKQEKEMEELKAKQKADAEALILKARKLKEEEEQKVRKQKELELKIKKQREIEAARKAAELKSLWEPVKTNADDFNAWTKLLDYVENDKNIENIRPVYDEFLARYPYCYGYWRKYSELESEAGNIELCINIFEKGLSSEGIELSVDLWIAYLDWAQSNLLPGSNEDQMRDLYERSVKAAGLDFRSDKLWEHYISWENRGGRLGKVTALYDRLLTTPTQMYYQNWENFKRHVEENDPRATIPENELKLLLESLVGENTEKVSITFLGSYQYKCTQSFIESREKTSYQTTYEAISERWNYEEKIRRPYFHIKSLENSQLTNWNEYLDFEISKGGPERIRVLFERCLIACAMYEYFWIKFAKYLENTLCDLDAARDVWRRACTVHLQKKPTAHWYWALFEERYPKSSDSTKAVEILSNLEKHLPKNMIVTSRKIDSLRRSGAKSEEVCSCFEASIERFKSQALYPSASLLTNKYARYLHKVVCDSDKAIKVLQNAIDGDQRNESLYRHLLDIAYQKQPMDVSLFCHLATIAIESSLLSPESKQSICKRKLQVVEEFETDANKLKEAYNEYETLCQATKSSEEMVATSKNLSDLLCLQTDSGSDQGDVNVDPNAYSAGIYDPLMQFEHSVNAADDDHHHQTKESAENSTALDSKTDPPAAANQEISQQPEVSLDTSVPPNNYYSQYQNQDANYYSNWNPWNAYYSNYQNAQYSSWNSANNASMMPHYSG